MKIRSLVVLLAAGVALALSGCATEQPSSAQMLVVSANYQLPRQPAAGKAMVYVVFEEASYEQVGFDVFLNDQKPASAVGRNQGGQYFYFELTPGEHKIFSKSKSEKLAKQAELAVTARTGEVIYIRQKLHFGMLGAGVELLQLDEVEGKYYVSKLKPGLAVTPMLANVAETPLQQGAGATAAADTFRGKVTGGNLAKGVGFSNINIKLLVTPEGGEPVTFFVRSDSKVFDASGKQVDYQQAFKTFGKRVEIQHFVIQDATGGEPGRNDFKYEIGQKGVRTMRILD